MAVRFARGARGLGGLLVSGAVAAARRSLLGVLAGLTDLVGGCTVLPGFTRLTRHAAQLLARLADVDHGLPQAVCGLVRDRGKALAGTAIRLASETGMIEAPTVDNEGILTAKTLMIPDLRPGALIVVEGRRVKGNFRARKCTWSGDTSGQDWTITTEAERY